jgi:hypothetical protein
MDPSPCVYIAIIVGCAAAAIDAVRFAASWRRAARIGALTGAAYGAVLPPLLFAVLLGEDWSNPAWCLKCMAVIGGLMAVTAAAVAAPCGAVCGVAGHLTWQWSSSRLRRRRRADGG